MDNSWSVSIERTRNNHGRCCLKRLQRDSQTLSLVIYLSKSHDTGRTGFVPIWQIRKKEIQKGFASSRVFTAEPGLEPKAPESLPSFCSQKSCCFEVTWVNWIVFTTAEVYFFSPQFLKIQDHGQHPCSFLQKLTKPEALAKEFSTAFVSWFSQQTSAEHLLSVRCCEWCRGHRTGKLPLGSPLPRMETTWTQIITTECGMCPGVVESKKASWRRLSLSWILESEEPLLVFRQGHDKVTRVF